MKIPYPIDNFLNALSEKLGLEINPDIEGGLVLLIDEKYKIQIEFLEDRVLISSVIGEILPSRYRHQVFQDALKANFKSSAYGTLGYSSGQKLLLLILSYPIIPPNDSDLVNGIEGFILKSKAWTDALQGSNTRLLT
jgi:hypothetical protein